MLQHLPPWRNWLARSAVNRKVGGSSPPGGGILFLLLKLYFYSNYPVPNNSPLKMVWNGEGKKEFFDPGRIRTCNLLIRSQTRYPLRHWTQVPVEY